MTTYRIIRFYRGKPRRVMRTGLTLEGAQVHCNDENTHEFDANGNVLWFDGYEEE